MTETCRRARPRLLVLTSTYPRWSDDPEPGFVHQLSKRLVAAFDVTVLSPHAPGALRQEVIDGVEVHRFRYAPVWLQRLAYEGGIVANLKARPWTWLLVPAFLLAQICALWKLCRQWQPHVVHAHWMIPQGFLACMLPTRIRRDISVVVTCHGADLFALRAWPMDRIKRFVLRRADSVTVVSEAMRTHLVHLHAQAGGVAVCPMGADLQRSFTPARDLRRAEAELLFVGRLVEKKGLHHLLDALPDVVARIPSVSLTVVGSGPNYSALTRRAKALGLTQKVRFLGAVGHQDLPEHLRRATLLVAPFAPASSGDQEGLGLVVVEAMGCGCPVIVGDVPAVHDVIDSSTALIVNAADASALSHAICHLLENPEERAERAARGLERVQTRFDWSVVASTYGKLLMTSAKRHASANQLAKTDV
jgi:glycosyltransferase involved in cell wall biosynthesis